MESDHGSFENVEAALNLTSRNRSRPGRRRSQRGGGGEFGLAEGRRTDAEATTDGRLTSWVQQAINCTFASLRWSTSSPASWRGATRYRPEPTTPSDLRVTPTALVRYGAYVQPGGAHAGFINIGAYVGRGAWWTPGRRSGPAPRSGVTST